MKQKRRKGGHTVPMNALKGKLSKGLTKRGLRHILYGAGIALGAALLVMLIVFFTRPKLLWYVDEDISAAWIRIQRESAPPFSRYEVLPRPEGAAFPSGRFGFTVSCAGPAGQQAQDAPVMVYRNLAQAGEYEGWMVLAVDPWMVFRKHQDPEPGRSFLDITNERGTILLAGTDQAAVHAWLCQLLQTQPGVFTPGSALWQDTGRNLVMNHPFQSGAFTYSWVQIWPLLFRDDVASVYAPISQARSLPPQRGGRLAASRFPVPEGWSRYGLQADILWAKMYGAERYMKRLAPTEQWLKSADTQTVIANTLEWIPAHQSGVAYNTISWETHMAYLRSSFIWQGVRSAKSE